MSVTLKIRATNQPPRPVLPQSSYLGWQHQMAQGAFKNIDFWSPPQTFLIQNGYEVGRRRKESVFSTSSYDSYAADLGNTALDHFLFHPFLTRIYIFFFHPCPRIMTLIAEDLIEFNAISSTVVLIIPQVIAIRNKIFSVQTNLWSIRVSWFFGARRKIKFSSNAFTHPSAALSYVWCFLLTQATKMYVPRCCLQLWVTGCLRASVHDFSGP